MQIPGPRAVSVNPEGEEDGWQPDAGWFAEITPRGDTRLTAQVPVPALAKAHRAMVAALAPPLSVLYRQKVHRQDPKPQGSPPRDFVARDVPQDVLLDAIDAAAALLYGDARAEIWVQGGMGERLVLDEDGVIYAYPDDPVFRDALTGAGIEESDVDLISDRDYVKHWFHAECDALEAAFVAHLRLTEVPHRGGNA